VPCEEYRPLVQMMGEGELPPEQASLLSDHLPDCPSCRKAVRLLRLSDAAVRDALLGLPGTSTAERHQVRRLVRLGAIATVAVGVVLLSLWGLYRSFEDRARTDREKQQGAAALERLVLPRSRDRVLPVVLGDLEKQAGAPIDVVRPPADPPLVTFSLERRVTLRSALSLLSEFYDLTFLVGRDRIVFPDEGAPGPATDPTMELRRKIGEMRITLNYDGDDLSGALEQLRNVKGLNLVVAPSSASMVAEAKVRFDVGDLLLADVLDRVLSPAGLRWEVRHEVVVIR